MTEPTFPVAEIFGPTIQGEGGCAGKRTHFVRFAYCDGLPTGWCNWCDSMHAVDPKNKKEWDRLTPDEIWSRLCLLPGPTRTVTLTGGNPLLYDLAPLLDSMVDDWDVWVETQGTIYRPWVDQCNLTVSPKPPSAGTCDRARLDKFLDQRLWNGWGPRDRPRTILKIPVDPAYEAGADLEFARELLSMYTYDTYEFEPYLSVVTYPTDTRDDVINRWRAVVEWLGEADMPDVACLPQLHVLLWGHELGR